MKTRHWITMLSAGLSLAGCGDDTAGSGGTGGSTTSSGTSTSTSTHSATVTGSTTVTTTTSTGSGVTTASGTGGAGGAVNPPPGEDWARDIVSTGLELDVTTLHGKATIVLAHSTSLAASFEVGDLAITSVSNADGPLNFDATTTAGQLDVGVPSDAGDATVIVEYTFADHPDFDGWSIDSQVSFLWPYFCGNLYPCKSDPSDGLTFTMSVTGVPAGTTAIYPQSIPGAAPSYMPAIAVADFTDIPLGATTAGTNVHIWHLPGQHDDAVAGTEHLVDVFDFYETTYGAYTFGNDVGTVSANWGGGDYGGMEHHPYWHVSSGSIYSEEVNAHEAAHGWYGDGVRIKCWEDFVLSEGTATYLSARSLEESGVDLWPDFECQLKSVCTGASNTIALPDTCDAIDILNDPLWSNVPYMKGAFFYKAVADLIGQGALDTDLANFYQAHVGEAAKMQDLVDYIKSQTTVANGTAIDTLETDWLQTLECPVDPDTLCL